MGWKGTVRSIQAASRAAERDAKRRQREREKQHRELMKQAELAHAADVVAAYEDVVESLSSVHRHASADVVDWEAIASYHPGPPPERGSDHEDQALESLTDYSPSLMDKVLGRGEKRVRQLEEAVGEGRRADDAAHDRAIRVHRAAITQADHERQLAERVLSGDPAAFRDALHALHPFDEISDLGTNITFGFSTSDGDGLTGLDDVLVRASISVHGKDIIPEERFSLLQSGKLSKKKMPVGQYNELHQDYVCGCLLRVASELLAILPVEGVVVTATDEMLDTSTGHIEEQAIASVYAPRRTMERLNLQAADASDSMANFLHRMTFRKTKGFAPVDELTREDIPALAASD